MYIWVVANGYPTEKNKGLGLFEMDQAKALQSVGNKVIYISIDLRSIRRRRTFGFNKKTVDGILVYSMSLPVGRITDCLSDYIGEKALTFVVRKVIKENGRPEIVHAHFTNIGIICARIKDKFTFPLVITEHSSEMNSRSIEFKKINRAKGAYKKADALIAVSTSFANILKLNSGLSFNVVHNVVDLDTFKFINNDRRNEYQIVSVGNLLTGKGHDILIRAFIEAQEINPLLSLLIIGEGPEHKKLQELVTNYGQSGNISFLGSLPRDRIGSIFSNSGFFVLVSKSETFGVAYIEAMAAGLPVIATKCGGPEDFINNKVGILVEVDNVHQIAQAILKMASNILYYDRKDISEFAETNFCPQKIASDLVRIYYKATEHFELSQTFR